MNRLKSLNWYDEPGRPFDGKSNGSVAYDDVKVGDNLWHRCYISYNVRRGSSAETDNKWFILIQFPNKSIREEVNSLEEGKIICEHYREVFWNILYDKITKQIFKED